MRWATLQVPAELMPAWLGARAVRLPACLSKLPRVDATDTGVIFNFDIDAAIACLAEEQWLVPSSSPTTWVPFSYLSIPAPLRRFAATLIYLRQRWLRPVGDPGWPIAAALDVLLEMTGRRHIPDWEAGWAVSITHDVDTIHGLRNAHVVADIVEEFGYRACFFIVGDALQGEPSLARELHARGHEIASHDMAHDNRLYQLSCAEQDDRLRRALATIEPYGGTGFRAPSLRRTAALIERIGKVFSYDSSACDVDFEQRRGCTTVLPYQLRGCLEIPITLTPDASLMYAGYGPEAVLRLWKEKCDYIRTTRGVAILVTHTEPHFTSARRLWTLRAFLEWVRAQNDVTVLQPAEIATRAKRPTRSDRATTSYAST